MSEQEQSFSRSDQKPINIPELQKNISQQLANREKQKSQNPKIGRPAKTNQQEEFKKCYLQNKQKFELQCELLVYIHQTYFDEIIDNPINVRVAKSCLDRFFIACDNEQMYISLLALNEEYFKNSSNYPEEKLRYTSLIDIAYMCRSIKERHGPNLSCTQILLIIFFHLYNQKLVNQSVFEYFYQNWDKLRQGMIFGPSGQSSKKDKFKLQKLDKLVICLALTLADLEQIQIEEEIQSWEQQGENAASSQDQQQNSGPKRQHISEDEQVEQGQQPRKKIHNDFKG